MTRDFYWLAFNWMCYDVIFGRLYHSAACCSINHGLPGHRQCLHHENLPQRRHHWDGDKEKSDRRPGWQTILHCRQHRTQRLARWNLRLDGKPPGNHSRRFLLGLCELLLIKRKYLSWRTLGFNSMPTTLVHRQASILVKFNSDGLQMCFQPSLHLKTAVRLSLQAEKNWFTKD